MDGKTKRLPNSNLKGLRFVPYYGCMLARPPDLRHEKNYHGLMEKLLSSYGADPLPWSFPSRCCGTFLSVSKPEASAFIVNQILENAVDSGAECIVTACAMFHLNIEIRCTLKDKLPILHFSEILSVAFKTKTKMDWFAHHLIDPVPILRSRNLIAWQLKWKNTDRILPERPALVQRACSEIKSTVRIPDFIGCTGC